MSVTLTETAAKEVKSIMERQCEDGRKDGQAPEKLYLRLGVKGGGCSGLSYSLDLTEAKGEEDESWEQDGIEVVCDSKSLLYLDGATVDFKDGLMGRGFVFNNPNPNSSCGCGSSCPS